jgi:hypothetical protein
MLFNEDLTFVVFIEEPESVHTSHLSRVAGIAIVDDDM